MVSGHSQGKMVVCLIVSVSFTEAIIFMHAKFLKLILMLVSIVVQISTTNSDVSLKSARPLKLSTIGKL